MKSPKEIVDIMLSKDAFSIWLGVVVEKIEQGTCILSCELKDDMLNGFEIAHGGISYSLSDSALAFAANSYGFKCVSIETSISHTKTAKLGDRLTAICTEINRSKRIGLYEVRVVNQNQQLIAYFKGTVNISELNW